MPKQYLLQGLRGQVSSGAMSAQHPSSTCCKASGVRSAQESGQLGTQVILVAKPQGSGQCRGQAAEGSDQLWASVKGQFLRHLSANIAVLGVGTIAEHQ